MPVQATVILDSGCLLQGAGGKFIEIGYFEPSKSMSGIRVLADWVEKQDSAQLNPGRKCVIEVRYVKANGQPKKDSLEKLPVFHDRILHMKDLHGHHMFVDCTKFDCVAHFDTGYFCGSLVKQHRVEGTLASSPSLMKQPSPRRACIRGASIKSIVRTSALTLLAPYLSRVRRTLEAIWLINRTALNYVGRLSKVSVLHQNSCWEELRYSKPGRDIWHSECLLYSSLPLITAGLVEVQRG